MRLRRFLPLSRRLNRLAHIRPRGAPAASAPTPTCPMLTHFCELVRTGKRGSETMPLSLSTAVLDLIDRARQLPRP